MIDYPVTVCQAAKYLQVGRKLIYALIFSGQIRAQKRKNRWEIDALPVESKPLTVNAIAKSHDVSTRLIRRMVIEGRIEGKKIGQKKWIIERSEAIKMLDNPHFLQ